MSDAEGSVKGGSGSEAGSDGEEEAYEVERIVAHKKKGKGKGAITVYLVKWKGYAEEENTWEEEENLAGSPEILAAYLEEKAASEKKAKKAKPADSDDDDDDDFALEKVKAEPKSKRSRKSGGGAKSRETVESESDSDGGAGKEEEEDPERLPATEDCDRFEFVVRPRKLPDGVPSGTPYFLGVFQPGKKKLLVSKPDALKLYPEQLGRFLAEKVSFREGLAVNGNGHGHNGHDKSPSP